MTIRKFLQEVLVCIGTAIKDSLAINKKPAVTTEPEATLTAMGYTKQMDLFELMDYPNPQCKCDDRG